VTIGRDRIAVQLYDFLAEIRADDDAQRQANVHRVLATIAGLGYRQFENFGGLWGWSAEEFRAVFESYGLRAVGDHGDLDPATFDARLDDAQALGLRYVGSSGWPAPGFDTLDHALETATVLNELGERAAARGLTVYGHNHETELTTRFDGRTALDVLIENTEPGLVTFELDVHWAWVALGLGRFDELLDLLGRHSSRIALLHVKGTAANGELADVGVEEDATDWRAVVRAARDVDLYIHEYDFPPDPAASAATALAYLESL
jgi:sugar phosphate isomerase/epimerase